MMKKILLITLGYKCNNSCIFCTVSSHRHEDDADNLRVIETIKNNFKEDYSSIEFIGGEPTLYPHLPEYILLAKKTGYKNVILTTNGRALSYSRFLKKIYDSGLNSISITAYSHDKDIHDAITRTPGSFEQTIEGIKNAKKIGLNVYINTVVCRLNYKDLGKTAEFFKKIGVKQWYLIDLSPEGTDKRIYYSYMVRLNDLSPALNSLSKIEGITITFADFPECIFNDSILKKKNIIIEGKELRHVIHQKVYGESDRTKQVDGKIYDTRKIMTQICNGCVLANHCGGLWKEYYDRYDDNDIKKLKVRR
jgi:MoaA/NifB/PqqE/SkfB family radical SAM enzyme